MPCAMPEHILKDQSLARRINVAVENLKLAFKPEKIILFGSYARGDFSKNSTIDIFVIAETQARFVDRIRGAIEVTGGEPPIEPIVYTPEEFAVMREQGEGFIENALDEGFILYEKNVCG